MGCNLVVLDSTFIWTDCTFYDLSIIQSLIECSGVNTVYVGDNVRELRQLRGANVVTYAINKMWMPDEDVALFQSFSYPNSLASKLRVWNTRLIVMRSLVDLFFIGLVHTAATTNAEHLQVPSYLLDAARRTHHAFINDLLVRKRAHQ